VSDKISDFRAYDTYTERMTQLNASWKADDWRVTHFARPTSCTETHQTRGKRQV